MAQDQVESTSATISYGNFINKFLPDTIKSILQLERTHIKYVDKTSILSNEIYMDAHVNHLGPV